MKTFILILLTILLVGHPEAGVKIKEESVKEDSSQKVEVYAIDIINQARTDAGLKRLVRNQLLVDSATAKACDLRDRDYWAHIAPDGTTPWKFFADAGYTYTHAGENLCRNFNEVDCALATLKSGKHRKNILSPKFEDIGIGNCGIFVVQHFGAK